MVRFLVRPVASLFLLFLLAFPLNAAAQDVAAYFEANCAACHTIGSGKPPLDLAGVTARKDRQWLVRFVSDPEGVVASGDAYAKELVNSADGMVMPRPDGMTANLAEALIAWIARAPAGQPLAHATGDDRPFTPDDVARGRELFTGARTLAGAGPPCVSCHALNGLGVVAGGTLGPDLTLVHARLRGRAGLTAWLATPPTPVMRGVYRSAAINGDEARALVALFEDAAVRQPAPSRTYSVRLAFIAALTALFLLILMGVVWRGRLRGVRRELVGAHGTEARSDPRAHALGGRQLTASSGAGTDGDRR